MGFDLVIWNNFFPKFCNSWFRTVDSKFCKLFSGWGWLGDQGNQSGPGDRGGQGCQGGQGDRGGQVGQGD